MVKSFTTPGDNMGNTTAAGLAANPSRSHEAARQAAWRAFRLPEVREAIADEMAKHGAGIGWRIKTLRAVGDPGTVLTEEKETTRQVKVKGASGDVDLPAEETSRTITRRSPSPADIARIVDTLNKMDGIYSQQAAQAQVTARYATLAGRFHAILGNLPPTSEEDVPMSTNVQSLEPPVPFEAMSYKRRPKLHTGILPTIKGRDTWFKQGHAPNAHSEATTNAASVKADSCTA